MIINLLSESSGCWNEKKRQRKTYVKDQKVREFGVLLNGARVYCFGEGERDRQTDARTDKQTDR